MWVGLFSERHGEYTRLGKQTLGCKQGGHGRYSQNLNFYFIFFLKKFKKNIRSWKTNAWL